MKKTKIAKSLRLKFKKLIRYFNKRIDTFIASVCTVLQFKIISYEIVFAEIIIQKCLPILFYGLDCCALNTLNFVSRVWNMAFKWLYNLRKYDSTR